MTAPNPLVALKAFLAADAGVAAQVTGRVYGAELPQSVTPQMPRKCILLRNAGGYVLNKGWMELGDPRIDAFCYGLTPFDASEVYMAVHTALKQMTRNVQGNTMLHWARPSGGPISTRQDDTEWPLVLSSWQVLVSERQVA